MFLRFQVVDCYYKQKEEAILMKFDYDITIIGAGAAGITAAKTAVGFGKKVALIEPNKIGGECTWTGCVPSKSIIKSAHIAHHIKNAQKWGINTDPAFDTNALFGFIKSRIKGVYSHTEPKAFQEIGIAFFNQSCSFINKHTIQMQDTTRLHSKYVIVCTGSSPFVPDIEGLHDVAYMTNVNFFDQQRLPKSLLILGGGPIGVEMASACNRLGVEVTIVEMQERILPREDEECVRLLTEHMQSEGVKIKISLRATQAAQEENLVKLRCVDKGGNAYTLHAEKLLVAVGRKPNVEGLSLKSAGVNTGKKGIVTNAYLQTSAKHIYACGDVVGPYQFSHMAWQQAVLAVRNICIPFFKKKIDYKNVIWATFTAPELASAGMTEKEAIDTFGQKSVKIYRQLYKNLDRAITDNEEIGLVKMVCNNKGKLLGMHILGAHAGDFIHEAQLAKWYNIPLQKIQPVIHAYPTYAELIWQTGKQAYVDQLLRNPFVRLYKWLTSN